jgi:3-hydroxypropanoate dehydrogenase
MTADPSPEAAHVLALRAALPDLPQAGLDLLFGAHTHHAWDGRPVAQATLRRLLALTFGGPTAYNQQPLRVIFVASPEAKARLSPAVSRSNRDKTLAAPVTAILCHDLRFFDHLPRLWPQADVRPWYDGQPEAARLSALRNGTLQAGYFLMAARALGLDAGPMSGFDPARVAADFLQGRDWEVNFLVNLGHGDPAAVRPRNPRLGFDEVAAIL